jgi:homoserine dehydrogenase
MTAKGSSAKPLGINVGLIGVGVVGSAVLDFFAKGPLEVPIPGARFGEPSAAKVRLWSASRRTRRNPNAASEEAIVKIVSRDERGKPRFYADDDGRGPGWRAIVRDPKVDIVVEVTGSPVAEAMIEESLWLGKSVVTANKKVLSRSGYELVKLAQSRGAILACEAAVGGGMPVVQVMGAAIGGRITGILAIINGTTNFILSKMRDAALSGNGAEQAYPSAVAEAQKAGLAEADPAADVYGEDAQSKIIILAGLAFGIRVKPKDVYVRGIARQGSAPGSTLGSRAIFDAPDLHYLDLLGYAPKLLAGAQISNGHVVAWVQPAAVPKAHPLARVEGSGNAALLRTESPVSANGMTAKGYDIFLNGPGAGGPETASSVIADILFCARQIAVAGRRDDAQEQAPLYSYTTSAFNRTQPYGRGPSLTRAESLKAPYLLRFINRTGGSAIATTIAAHLGENGIRIKAGQGFERAPAYLYFTTEPASLSQVESALQTVIRETSPGAILPDILYLPIMSGACFEEAAKGKP